MREPRPADQSTIERTDKPFDLANDRSLERTAKQMKALEAYRDMRGVPPSIRQAIARPHQRSFPAAPARAQPNRRAVQQDHDSVWICVRPEQRHVQPAVGGQRAPAAFAVLPGDQIMQANGRRAPNMAVARQQRTQTLGSEVVMAQRMVR